MRYALIGMGGMGSRWASILPSLDAVVDPQYSNVKLEDVLTDKNIKAVVIATPHGNLAKTTRMCLSAGKHVLCEKPGSLTSKELMENMVLAANKGLIFMVSYNHRYHDAFIKARKLVKKIGKILFIRGRYGFGGRKGYNKEWRLNRKKEGSGELVDQGVHLIDLAISFIGTPVDVKGFTSNKFWKMGDDNAFVLLRGENDELVSLHVSVTQWNSLFNFEIYGEKGYLSVEGLGKRYGEDERLVFGLRNKDFGRNIKPKVIKCNPVADNSLKRVFKVFRNAIKTGIQPYQLDAYETLQVVEDIYKQNK